MSGRAPEEASTGRYEPVDLLRLLADPRQALTLPEAAVPPLMAQCAALQSALAARLVSSAGDGQGQSQAPVETDKLLTAKQAAERLGVSADTMYRKRWPFEVRPTPGTRRFSQQGIERYIRQKQGR